MIFEKLIAFVGLACAMPLSAQMPDAEAMRAEQRAAMEAFAFMDGEWRGTVTSQGPEGETVLTQTERVGTMAGGVVRIVEGRGYADNGDLEFNAVAMIAYDPMADEYVMTSTAQGFTARPWFRPTENGFEWGLTSGPVTFTYEAVVEDGRWAEDGYMQFGEEPRRKFLEMRLERVADSDWPGAGVVGPE
ncbi:hypothetical protein [Qipengyuania sp.]|uniref:hypothetical protein n=1 Tax=Qipengyuania sp. TaxID=2004515 RepID=UPI003BAB0216